MELLAHSALQDFATSSLQVAVSQQNQELQQKSDPLKNYEIVERRRWEQRFVIILQFPKIYDSVLLLSHLQCTSIPLFQ